MFEQVISGDYIHFTVLVGKGERSAMVFVVALQGLAERRYLELEINQRITYQWRNSMGMIVKASQCGRR